MDRADDRALIEQLVGGGFPPETHALGRRIELVILLEGVDETMTDEEIVAIYVEAEFHAGYGQTVADVIKGRWAEEHPGQTFI